MRSTSKVRVTVTTMDGAKHTGYVDSMSKVNLEKQKKGGIFYMNDIVFDSEEDSDDGSQEVVCRIALNFDLITSFYY